MKILGNGGTIINRADKCMTIEPNTKKSLLGDPAPGGASSALRALPEGRDGCGVGDWAMYAGVVS